MKSCVFFVVWILAFVSAQGAVAGQMMLTSSSTISSPARSQRTPPSHTAIPKSSGKTPTSYLTHRSYSTTGSSTRSHWQKTATNQSRVPKSSGKVPIPTILSTCSMKTSARPTIGTTSHKKPTYSKISRISTAPKSSLPPAMTTANSTTTQKSTRSSTLGASKTLTVSDRQTASAQVGWVVVGVGAGGFVSVGGSILRAKGISRGTQVRQVRMLHAKFYTSPRN